jgi:hypothetical protein
VRAIEDLKRSGYRPLLHPEGCGPLVHPEGPRAQGATGETLCCEKGFRQRVGKAPRADQEGLSGRGAPRQRADIGPYRESRFRRSCP